MKVKRPLLRPLRDAEDLARTNPDLLKALKVATSEQALQKMKEYVDGHKEERPRAPKRERKGAPHTSTVLLEAAGLPTAGIPEIIHVLIMERVVRDLRDKKAAGTHLNFEKRARRMLREETWGGWPNRFCLHANRDTIKDWAKTFTESARPGIFSAVHEKLVNKMEIRYPRWRCFEPLLLDLLPIYLEMYVTTDAGPNLWNELFNRCEQHYALLDKFKHLVVRRYGPSAKPNPATMMLFYAIHQDGGHSDIAIRNFTRLPSCQDIDNLVAEADHPVDQILFDWGSFIEHDEVTGIPFFLSDLGPGSVELLNEAPIGCLPLLQDPPFAKWSGDRSLSTSLVILSPDEQILNSLPIA
jgi:hypothetical protein